MMLADNCHDNHLLDCLKLIAKKIGVYDPLTFKSLQRLTIETVHHCQSHLQISLCSLSVNHLEKLENAFFPVLIQFNEKNSWRVLIKNRMNQFIIYNPSLKSTELFSASVTNKILKCWQCFPLVNFVRADYLGLFKLFFKFFKMDLAVIIMLAVLTACAPILLALFPKYLLNHMSQLKEMINIVLIVLLIGCHVLLCYINEVCINQLTLKLACYTVPTLRSRLVSLDVANLCSSEFAQILSNYELALLTLVPLLLSLCMQAVSVLLLIIYISYYVLWLACIAVCLCLLSILIKILFFPKQFNLLTKKITRQSQLSNFLTNIFLHIDKIRTSHIETDVQQKWQTAARAIKLYEAKFCKLEHTASLFEAFMPILLFSCFYGFLSTLALQEDSLMMIIICIMQLSVILKKFSSDSARLLYLLPSLKRAEPLMQAKIERSIDKKWITHFNGYVRFSNIKLLYKDAQRPILNDISFEIQPGSFVAFVGSSGAGKSSLFRLLLGFIQPTSGKIMIDEENINDLALPLLRKHFGVVLQTTTIIPGTIFSNIVANAALTLADAWELSAQLGLADEIRKMPMQMFTYISDHPGDSISGGQKQKILLARALANQPKILLLDEATSAMDNKSQALVYQFLNKMNITRLVIAHRMSTIKEADMIYVLQQGSIIDKGSYQVLSSKKNSYLSMDKL